MNRNHRHLVILLAAFGPLLTSRTAEPASENPIARRVSALVDVMRVPATGDPTRAIVDVSAEAEASEIRCDVLVVGGGTGGVAAAWAAARQGRNVCLVEETDWIGGQFTTQGVSALDEHEHIEAFGGTRTYYRLREAIRDHYRPLAIESARSQPQLNPGTCWVTRLAFEPRVALRTLETFLAPVVEAGRLKIFLRTKAAGAETKGDRVVSVTTVNLDDRRVIRFLPAIVLDATELGDLLPLTGAEYRIGAEAKHETGEAHAQPLEAKAHCVQSFTYTFALERRPGERHVIATPDRYTHYRDRQPYSLRIEVHGGEIYSEKSGWLAYEMFERAPGTKGGLWSYRRLIDRQQFNETFPRDISMFNWPGNDYRDTSILDRSPAEVAQALQDAKRVSLGFLYWLQTEVAHPGGGGGGFPEIKLRPDVMGTADGLSKHPYIRETRRIKALKTVVEQEVSADYQPGPRAARFPDSVGIGWYPIDIHRAGEEDVGVSCRTKPFQIPLGALIPVRLTNLLAANKNIGTTHITNGCYRLQPVEWNIGEAAGSLAAFALETQQTPRAIHGAPLLLRQFQRRLLDEGVPLHWFIDVPVSHTAFGAVQRMAIAGVPKETEGALEFRPDDLVSRDDRARWVERVLGRAHVDPADGRSMTRAEFAAVLDRLMTANKRD